LVPPKVFFGAGRDFQGGFWGVSFPADGPRKNLKDPGVARKKGSRFRSTEPQSGYQMGPPNYYE